MYSVVLMTALVTTTGTATWHNRGQQHCSVAVCSCSCYGGYGGYAGYSGYAGYAGYGYGGCCQGYIAPIQGYGAAGGCYGYHGGCYGGFGNTYADPHFGGCYGCYGGHSGYGVPVPGLISVGPARVPTAPVFKDPTPPINPKYDIEEVAPLKEKKKDAGKPKADGSVRATVRIEVPAGGKLFVDGQLINVAAGVRTFQTPALEAGQAYYYDIRIEIEQNGAIRREERRIVINPGEESLVRFPALRAGETSTAQVNR